MNEHILQPFSPDQTARLNRWQANDRVHPFTCGNDHPGDRRLVAHEDGWHCPSCSYRQSWAHAFMLFEPPAEYGVQ